MPAPTTFFVDVEGLRVRKRRLVRIGGGLLLLPLACIAILWLYRFAYTDWERITEFGPFTDFAIPDSNYKLMTRMDNQVIAYVSLVDTQTNAAEALISGYSPHLASFQHNDQTYTLIRLVGGGSDDGYDYVILRLEPRMSEVVHACGNPKLIENALEFYDPAPNAQKCDWFPFDWREFPVIQVKLN